MYVRKLLTEHLDESLHCLQNEYHNLNIDISAKGLLETNTWTFRANMNIDYDGNMWLCLFRGSSALSFEINIVFKIQEFNLGKLTLRADFQQFVIVEWLIAERFSTRFLKKLNRFHEITEWAIVFLRRKYWNVQESMTVSNLS